MADAVVSGASELDASIIALNAQLNAALPDIVMSAALLIEDEIRRRAPVETGALMRSLDAKADRRKDAASAIVQIETSGPGGVEHYAIFQEFGTSRTPAQPFFRPGVEAASDKVAALVEQRIMGIIEQ